jgi:uncharacterized repeat protein (TIGR03987 family)
VTESVRIAAAFMAAALAFYTVGVWSARLAAGLKPWHLAMFWAGLACDTIGTERMRRLVGGLRLSFHGVTGALALALMLGHALWATVVLLRRDERASRIFHRISVGVWSVWLVPFLSGMLRT